MTSDELLWIIGFWVVGLVLVYYSAKRKGLDPGAALTAGFFLSPIVGLIYVLVTKPPTPSAPTQQPVHAQVQPEVPPARSVVFAQAQGGFCPNCGAARTGQRFCATCGNDFWRAAAGAVAPSPPTGSLAPPAAAPAQPIDSGAMGAGTRWAIIGIIVLVAILGGAVIVANLKGSGASVTEGDLPPTGSIWFGSSFDPHTLALSGRRASFSKNEQVALVAHLTRVSTGEYLTLSIDFGTFPAAWPVGQLAAGDDVVGVVLPAAELSPASGTVRIAVIDAGGNVLASGSITVGGS